MANRFKGEITVAHGGETYTLRCDFNAMCDFEEATGQDALAAFQAMEQGGGSIRLLRAMLHACLRRNHPEATVELAGDILSEDVEVVVRLIQASAPDQPAGAEAAGGKQKAA